MLQANAKFNMNSVMDIVRSKLISIAALEGVQTEVNLLGQQYEDASGRAEIDAQWQKLGVTQSSRALNY